MLLIKDILISKKNFALFASSKENFVKSLFGRKVQNGDLAHIFEKVAEVKDFL